MRRLIARSTIRMRAEGWTRGSSWSGIERVVKIVLLNEAQERFEAEDRLCETLPHSGEKLTIPGAIIDRQSSDGGKPMVGLMPPTWSER